MNKEEIKKKILLEKNANLIDIIEIAGDFYAKALLVNSENKTNLGLTYKYYRISENSIQNLTTEEIETIKSYFEINLGNIVY